MSDLGVDARTRTPSMPPDHPEHQTTDTPNPRSHPTKPRRRRAPNSITGCNQANARRYFRITCATSCASTKPTTTATARTWHWPALHRTGRSRPKSPTSRHLGPDDTTAPAASSTNTDKPPNLHGRGFRQGQPGRCSQTTRHPTRRTRPQAPEAPTARSIERRRDRCDRRTALDQHRPHIVAVSRSRQSSRQAIQEIDRGSAGSISGGASITHLQSQAKPSEFCTRPDRSKRASAQQQANDLSPLPLLIPTSRYSYGAD